MRNSIALPFVFLASWITHAHSFVNTLSDRPYSCPLGSSSASSSSSEGDAPKKPDLVDSVTFLSAIETLERENAKANAVDYVAAQEDISYVIGRLQVSLPIEAASGFDLIETPDLVLVSSVEERAAATGIQALDTIVGISAGDGFQESTKALDLDDTARIFTAAVEHALGNGMADIGLELNRLMKGIQIKKVETDS